MRYNELEQHVIDLFEREKFKTLIVGKPRPLNRSGECKTDVFIRGENTNDQGNMLDLKISIKLLESNEFLENKIKASRAEEIFGVDWQEFLRKPSTHSVIRLKAVL